MATLHGVEHQDVHGLDGLIRDLGSQVGSATTHRLRIEGWITEETVRTVPRQDVVVGIDDCMGGTEVLFQALGVGGPEDFPASLLVGGKVPASEAIDGLLDVTERMSPLGNATADECADFSIVLFSDLSRKVTMQNIYHDGGFSSMAMSLKAMTQYNKCLEEGDNL